LIERVGIDQIIFSSLNYDLMFELAAELKGFGTNYCLDKIDQFVHFVKIHGSVNFWPDFGANRINIGSTAGSNIDVNAPAIILDVNGTEHRFQNHGGWSPPCDSKYTKCPRGSYIPTEVTSGISIRR